MHKRILSALLGVLFLFSPALALEPAAYPLSEGVDVSVYQGGIDFAAVRDDGVESVYIRAGYGPDGVDSYLRQHYEDAAAAGLKVGFYYYMDAADPDSARLQARHFAALIRSLPADLRPAMDYEEFYGMDGPAVSAVALAFLETLEDELDQTPAVYADSYAAATLFTEAVARYPLWVAEWGVDAPTDLPNYSAWAGWQYTDRGLVSGINGYVDRDKFTPALLLEGAPAHRTYTVRPRDTLWAISLRYHTTVAALVSLNHIQDPNLIYPGQVLYLPIGSPVHPTYTVRPGDTLWAISLRYRTTVAALVSLNHIQNPDLIYPGQVLLLPEGA